MQLPQRTSKNWSPGPCSYFYALRLHVWRLRLQLVFPRSRDSFLYIAGANVSRVSVKRKSMNRAWSAAETLEVTLSDFLPCLIIAFCHCGLILKTVNATDSSWYSTKSLEIKLPYLLYWQRAYKTCTVMQKKKDKRTTWDIESACTSNMVEFIL